MYVFDVDVVANDRCWVGTAHGHDKDRTAANEEGVRRSRIVVLRHADFESTYGEAFESDLDAKKSVLDAEKSTLDADEVALDAERSALEADISALAEDRQAAESLTTLEGNEQTTTASKEHAALALSAKEEALRVKIQAFFAQKDAHTTKRRAIHNESIAMHNASILMHNASIAKHKASMAFVRLHWYHSHILAIMDSFRMVECTLRECAVMPQVEATETMSEETYRAHQRFIKTYCGENPNFAGSRKYVKNLYKRRKTLDHQHFMSSDMKEWIPGRRQLQKVAELWSSWILNCKISPGKASQDTNKEIADIVQRMRETLKNQSDPEPADLHSDVSRLPQEVASTQPFFVVLLDLISDCCHVITGANNRPRRIADGCLDNANRFLFVMLDTSLTLCCEMKPLFKKIVSLQDLHYEIFQQTVGFLSEVVHDGLNLWGNGAPTWATGITMNLAFITLYRLDLTMSEYSELAPTVAQLQLAESVKLPLLTLDCFNKWMQKDEARQKCDDSSAMATRHEKEIKELREELYQNNGGVDDDGVPLGIRLLWELMLKPNSDLFGPNYQEIFRSNEKKVGELLGTGSFGHVFSLVEEADAALKVSTLQNSVHLKKEFDILSFLGRNQCSDTTINKELALPVVSKFLSNLTAELGGGVKRRLTGLVFHPKGLPIRSIVGGLRNVEGAKKFESLLVHVSSQLKAALDFLHEKRVHHNDIAPKNIIVRSMDDAGWHVCLVDFGCASSPGEQKTGFEGTALYAHRSIFECYPSQTWEPVLEHDFFSLGLTMSALLNEGQPCWDMDPFPASLTDANRAQFCDAVKNRNKKATAKIKKSTCSKKQKEEWSSWITATGFSKKRPARSLPIRMNLRSATQKKELETTDYTSTSSPSQKRERCTSPSTDF